MELAEGSAIRYRRLGGIVSEIRLTVMPENLIDCNRGLMGQNALVLRGGGNFFHQTISKYVPSFNRNDELKRLSEKRFQFQPALLTRDRLQ